MHSSKAATCAIATCLASLGSPTHATMQNASRNVLPLSIELTDVEIRLDRETGGGCTSRCVRYQVIVRGDGSVIYEDLALPPVPIRERIVSADEVVALVNEFVRARFFESPDRYIGRSFYVRDRDQLLLRGMAGADGPSWDLRLRLGQAVKSVHLYLDYPDDLARLRDRVDRLGGPEAWNGK